MHLKFCSLSYKNDENTDDATHIVDNVPESAPVEDVPRAKEENDTFEIADVKPQSCETLGYSPNINDRTTDEFGML